jgi:O-antigen ligase
MAGMELFGWGTFAIVAVIGIYEYIRYKKNPIPSHPLTKYIMVLAVVLIVSILLSPYLATSEKGMWQYLGRTRPVLLFIFNLIILERFVNYRNVVKWVSWLLLPMVLVVTFMSVSGYDPIRGVHVFNWDWSFSNPRGIAGFFVTYIEYANIYELYLFILAAFLLLHKELKASYKVWLGITFVVTLFSLLLCGSRVVFLSIPFGLLIQMIVCEHKKVYIYAAAVFVVLCVVTYSASPFIRSKTNFTISNAGKFGDKYRVNLWRSHFELFKDHPITGAGFEMTAQENIQKEYFNKIGISGPAYDSIYKHMTKKAHNMFLYMLSGAGILGLIAFLTLLLAYTVYFWRTWKVVMLTGDVYDKVFLVGLAGASATIFSNMMFDTNIDSLRIAYSVVLVISLTAHLGLKYGVKTIFKSN